MYLYHFLPPVDIYNCMKGRQKLFLDRVINLIVDDTVINYGKDEIHFPSDSSIFLLPADLFSLSIRLKLFSEYCKKVYGLTDQEIDYVWKEYKDIILDKIENER